ncbi:MAG: septation protein SepH [Candidatus Dormibacteria bacterium]
MQELHVLGVSEDGSAVVLSGPPGSQLGPFHVARNETLRAAAAGRSAPAAGPATASALPPREIQARLRAGVPPAEIALAAGVPVERVLRYAGPVEAERAQVVAAARAALVARSPRHPNAVSMAATVDRALEGEIGWESWRSEDGSWTVQVRHDGGQAHWRWQPERRTVEPLDDAARQLVHGEPELVMAEPSPPADLDQAPSARARASVPAWDDILFGTGPRRTSGFGER